MITSKPIRDCDDYRAKKKLMSQYLRSLNKWDSAIANPKIADVLTDFLTDCYNQSLHYKADRMKRWLKHVGVMREEYPGWVDYGWNKDGSLKSHPESGWDPVYNHWEMPNRRSRGLFLTGSNGVGKTIAMRIIEDTTKIKFVTADELCTDFIHTKPEDKDTWWGNLQFPGNLIIDEIGGDTITNDWGRKFELIADIILVRYNIWKENESWTFMTTNLNKQDFITRYGEQTYSRVREMCECHVITGPDLRLLE